MRFYHDQASVFEVRIIWSGGFELTNVASKMAFEVWPKFPFISERLAIRDFPGWIWSEICGLQVDSNNLAGQNLRPRIEFDKRDLLITVVQDLAKRFIQEPELRLIEPKRDGEFQRVCRAGLDQRVMNASILREISAVAIN